MTIAEIDLTQTKDVIGAYKSQDYQSVLTKYTDPGTKYAWSVLSGEQPAGYKMELACFRHLQDLKRADANLDDFPFIYDTSKVKAILNFAAICPDVDTARPLPLMPWQKFILAELVGWRDQFGNKRFVQAYVSVARAQGKTYFAAILSAYAFLIESYGLHEQDFLVTANNAQQTTKLYSYVSDMVSYLIDNSVLFKKLADATGIEVQSAQIIAKKVHNRLVKISNESGKFDSYHFTNAIYDEAGDEKAGKYTSRIVTGQSNVKNHQFIKISTAYEFLGTEFYNDVHRTVEEMEKDSTRIGDNELCLVWDQDSEDEVYKPETWVKSNPLIGLLKQKDKRTHDLLVLRDSMSAQGKLAEFQNKSMNVYLQVAQNSFLNLADIERAIVPEFNIDGRDVYIGFDYSMFSDNTAIGGVFPYENDGHKYWYIFQHSFIPWQKAGSIEAKEKQDGIAYRELAKQGFCTITSHPKGIINDDQVYSWLRNYVSDHHLHVVCFGYDAMGATRFVKQLELNSGWNIMPIRQRTGELKDPTKFLQTGFIEGSIKRLDDKIMEKALLNAQIYEDKVGIQVDKAKATLKIDVVDALIDALYQGMYHFEDFGIANDRTKEVELMTPEKFKKMIENGQFGFGGDAIG
ncbi:MAG: terminase TerL endonuclease subunit [Schleiferilactobacillus perolens]|uniref:terminase large subunit n=1 Tax=Schleiferilactobacillus perolens TaxID=100468 RepID=UPI0039E9A9EC